MDAGYLHPNPPDPEPGCSLIATFRSRGTEDILVFSITVAEMEYGAAKSARPEENRDALIQFLSHLIIAPFDQRAADEYGLIRAWLERKGTPIGPMDLLIAAHAKSLHAVVVSDNIQEFQRIQDLSVENWIRH